MKTGQLQIINQSQIKISPADVKKDYAYILRQLSQLRLKNKKYLGQSLTLVFVDTGEMKKLNKQWRGKNYATDILSFHGTEGAQWGELVICPQVLKKQAKEQGLSLRQEFVYLLIHGLLHLLGYDHERRQVQARRMFQIQDKIFQSYMIDKGP